MITTKKTLAVLLCFGLVGAASACSADVTAASAKPVTIGIVAHSSLTWSAQLVAEGQGFLKQELSAVGSSYSVTEFPGGGPLTAAMSTGDVDFAVLPMTSVLALNAKSRGIQCLMTLATGGAVIILGAAKYKDSRGSNIAEYNHGNWGYSTEGSSGKSILTMLAVNAGLTWSDQNGVALGSTAANQPALASGRVDILSADPVSVQAALDNHSGYVIVNTNDPKDSQFAYSGTGQCLASTTSFIQKNPAKVQAVVNAELAGLKAVQKNLTDPAALVALFPPKADGTAWTTKEWTLVSPSFEATDGVPNEKTFTDSKALAERLAGITLDNATVQASFNTTFVSASTVSRTP